MADYLNHPVFQAGIAPFFAGLLAMALLHRVRLGGLAAVVAFATAVALVSGFQFSPLTASRKIILLVLAAPLIGILIDFAFKPTRIGAWVLGIAAAGGALWAFYPILAQKPLMEALLPGATALLLTGWLVGYMQSALTDKPVRAGSAGLALGLGAGVAAIFGAYATFGFYGVALGAGAGGLLLVQMIQGKRFPAGSTFVLTIALAAGLIASGAVILAQLQWYAALILALLPVAMRIPGPEKSPVWLQAVVYSFYGFVIATAACATAYYATRGTPV